jgi:hypothetical protein
MRVIFNLPAVHIEFVVDTVAMCLVLLPVIRTLPVIVIQQKFHTYSFYHDKQQLRYPC